ncbi:hypothetical protein C0033_18355 [Clostridium sp. chh4-2]|uniref:sulfatase-like hydrolase/transferase n=1 Tax=Clostridium sp. chh4-2 TaxID=2067550 RepID=UPI000CCF3145|nr:sulfatase-like hydrolase/transferase [Clostridium sp. chh4-2]PNV60482.1 hypothetical protein C0033_18355 [Clostridium sp. chh4-2]
MKDILVFISDQHSPLWSAFGGGKAETPVLNEVCASGTSFSQCYTSCPLCVPARMSMLTGKLPSKNGVMTNLDTIPDIMPTFLHPFVEAGYETVLIGRMHFVGKDQRHGFTKRLAKDMTPVSWNRPVEKLKEERGVFNGTYDARGCVKVIGGGETPVVNYDETVIQTALDYLNQDHEKPQLIVVGTYAPHFPYVAPAALYEKYRKRVSLPSMFHETPDYFNAVLENRKNIVDEETALKAQAAYLALIEYTDQKIGQVREAFREFTKKRGSKPLFCYLSDHGDQVGERDIFGKCTFFEASAKIPMMFEGDGIPQGKQIEELAGIMDLGPTLCSWAGVSQVPGQDGESLIPVMNGQSSDRMIVSEMLEKTGGRSHYGLMLRRGKWKYMVYSGYEDRDILFDLEQDPKETENVIHDYPEEAKKFRDYYRAGFNASAIEREQADRAQAAKWMAAWEKQVGVDDSERWSGNTAKEYPKIG